jgi:carboxypeptidase Q
MEAARILSSLEEKPRRTIRFLLFTGEEQGYVGSREYAKVHAKEMPGYKAGLIMDIGTAKLVGLSMHGQEQLVPLFKSCFSAVEDLGLVDFNMRVQGGTDHLSFQPHGVPAFAFIHAKSEYNLTHHTQSDTYDKALEKDLKQAACVMATGLWELANHQGEIPRFEPKKAPRRGRGGRRRR